MKIEGVLILVIVEYALRDTQMEELILGLKQS